MKKRTAARRFSLLVVVILIMTFVSESVMSVSAAGTKADWVNSDKYDDLEMYQIGDLEVYYSNHFFLKPSTTYDPHLATVSMVATDKSGAFSTIKEGATKEEIDQWCLDQPAKLREFFMTIGFEDFDTNLDYINRTAFDSIGVAAASREVIDPDTKETFTLIAVVPRSGSYFREWSNNIWLGDGTESDYMHEGWYKAANRMNSYIKEYVNTKNITGRVKLWMAGFSRGGATVNLAAGLLDNKLDKGEAVFDNGATLAHDDIFAYTFEAPQGANVNSKTVKSPKDAIYNNIWNIINPNDLVPKVAMSGFGFTRFGTDKFITTYFFDPEGFENNRWVFKALYDSIGGNLNDYKADNFQMYGTTVGTMTKNISATIGATLAGTIVAGGYTASKLDWIKKDDTKAGYDSNIACTILLEELVEQLGSREEYAQKIQPGLRELMKLVMVDQDGQMSQNIKDLLKDLPLAVVYCSLASKISPKLSEEVGASYARAKGNELLNLSSGMYQPFIKAVLGTWNNKPNELISVAKQMSEIFQNHNTYVTIAHMMAQDSYYIDRENTKGRGLFLVPLRDSAEMFRVSCNGMNDNSLWLGDTQQVVRLEGTKWGKSKVVQCDPGYAVGYYSYATNEKTEMFAPLGKRYCVGMKDHSKKCWSHTYEYWVNIQHSSLINDGKIRKQLDYHIASCWLSSDQYWRYYDT